MKTECDNNKRIIMLVLSVVFLIYDPDWFALASILLFITVLITTKRLDLDIGDILVFYMMYRYTLLSSGDVARAVVRALGYSAIYQLGKNATVSSEKNTRVSIGFVIAPAVSLFIKGLLDYSSLIHSEGAVELYWQDWSGNLLHRSYHEYYLVMMASLLIFFVYYTVKVSRTGLIGIVLSLSAVVIAILAKGRLAFWTCLLPCIAVGTGIVVEEKLYRKRVFRIIIISSIITCLAILLLFITNSFGLHDSYENSIWSEEGGLFFNDRFNMMGQQMKLYGRYLLNGLKNVEIDPGLINEAGEEVYYVSNSWLQIGREAKGIKLMLWVMAFSIYSLIILVKAWTRSRDVNKYIVISAFIGLTFLNMIEPIISNSIVFWALEVYLAGIVRALYNNAFFPKRWETGILMNYV